MLIFEQKWEAVAATTLNTISNISNVDISDAPRNNARAPPKVCKKSHTVGYCFFSVTSSTSRDSKKTFTYENRISKRNSNKSFPISRISKIGWKKFQNNRILPWQDFDRDDLLMHSYFPNMSLRCNIQVHWEHICCKLAHLWLSICTQSCTFQSTEANIRPEAIDWLIFEPRW